MIKSIRPGDSFGAVNVPGNGASSALSPMSHFRQESTPYNAKRQPNWLPFRLVEQVLEISNEFIQGFKAVMEFKILASNQNNYDETFSKV